MELHDIGRVILEGGNLKDKLMDFKVSNLGTEKKYLGEYSLKEYPARSKKLQFDSKQLKFPKKGSLHLPEKRAVALHFFANHELLAIEMMAAALVIFPTRTETDVQFKQGLLTTILDEQKHFTLYDKRMNELGVEFGDLPLSDFFWRYIDKIKTPEQFYSVIALTFEAANLDFAKYYKSIFEDVDDFKTADIMEVVYVDEISHVARGQKWLNDRKGTDNLWNYFCSLLPLNLTPDRSKGIVFDYDGRMRAGLGDNFTQNARDYKSNFIVTNRKEWKK